MYYRGPIVGHAFVIMSLEAIGTKPKGGIKQTNKTNKQNKTNKHWSNHVNRMEEVSSTRDIKQTSE
jgi:hypothetical protein